MLCTVWSHSCVKLLTSDEPRGQVSLSDMDEAESCAFLGLLSRDCALIL